MSAISLDSSWDDPVPRDRVDMDLLRGVIQVLLVVGNRPLGVNVQCHLLRIVVGMPGDGSDERGFCISFGLADLKADLVGSCNQMVKN